MKQIVLAIEGMSCSACSSAIEHYLAKQEGIKSVSVNLVMASANIEYDETKLGKKQIEEFISRAGYKSAGEYKIEGSKKLARLKKINLIIFSVLAVVLLYFSMGSMIGLPIFSFFEKPKAFAILILVLTCPFLAYGFDLFVSGMKSLFRLRSNMDSLVTIGVFASFAYSLYAFVMVMLGHEHFVHQLYFESSAIVVYFIKLGKFLDFTCKAKTKSAIVGLVQITPNSARVRRGNEIVQLSLDQVVVGDIVVCSAGEKIAVDGKVIKGTAHVDESFITGESKPAEKKEGDSVVAGSINYDGYLEYSALAIGKNSTISQIVDLVVKASSQKLPIAKTADKVSFYFVPFIIFSAVVTFIVYLILGYSFETSLITFVTVLVVSCPCALGLGTPVAIVISEGILAKEGVLIKKSEVLEIASKAQVVVFDKTGTLTVGRPTIKNIQTLSGEEIEAIKLACSVENNSSHPISSAFKEYQQKNKIELYQTKNFKEVSGYGIMAEVDGSKVLLGSKEFLEKHKVDTSKYTSNFDDGIVFIVKDKTLLAVFEVADAIRENAKELVKNFAKQNIETIMLTGDREETANKIASEIGISKVMALVKPDQKAKVIEELKKEGKRVVMVGDGINDSPALALADVGISIHSGTDIASSSSSVVLMSDDLNKIEKLISVSKRTIANIKQNLFWAFFYNILMVPIAMGVFRGLGVVISPMIASLAMTLSSLSVVLNALRLYIKKGEKNNGKSKRAEA